MNEVLFFPLSNEHGFKVDCAENYQHMIRTIIDAQIELSEDYPDHPVLVIYRLET